MQNIICILGCIALSTAQFSQPSYLNTPGVAPPTWQGPIADHINGIPPKDTPEVAAAKAALNQAYAQVLAVLPQLPPEERYQVGPHYVPVPQVPVQPHIPVVPQHNHNLGYQNFVPQVQTAYSTPQILAEEIPRSPIGEVPEVHAARVAHLKAYQDAVAVLPRFAETTTQQPYHYVPPVAHGSQYLNFPQDTPEVARAKAEHAAAVAALG